MRIGTRAAARFEGARQVAWAPALVLAVALFAFVAPDEPARLLAARLADFLPRDAVAAGAGVELRERIRIAVEVAPGREGTRRSPDGDLPWSGTGPYRFGYDRVLVVTLGTRRLEIQGQSGLDELGQRLAELHLADSTLAATIEPGRGCVYDDVLALLESARAAGFAEIELAGARAAEEVSRSVR